MDCKLSRRNLAIPVLRCQLGHAVVEGHAFELEPTMLQSFRQTLAPVIGKGHLKVLDPQMISLSRPDMWGQSPEQSFLGPRLWVRLIVASSRP